MEGCGNVGDCFSLHRQKSHKNSPSLTCFCQIALSLKHYPFHFIWHPSIICFVPNNVVGVCWSLSPVHSLWLHCFHITHHSLSRSHWGADVKPPVNLKIHIFRLWEEIRVPKENIHRPPFSPHRCSPIAGSGLLLSLSVSTGKELAPE